MYFKVLSLFSKIRKLIHYSMEWVKMQGIAEVRWGERKIEAL